MKYWKKQNGICGTMDNSGFVPDSVEITKEEYDKYISSIPVDPVKDPKKEYAKKVTIEEKIDYIASRLRLIDEV